MIIEFSGDMKDEEEAILTRIWRWWVSLESVKLFLWCVCVCVCENENKSLERKKKARFHLFKVDAFYMALYLHRATKNIFELPIYVLIQCI